MQRIIQINMAGRLIPIEEDAYLLLRDYLTSLERQFDAEEGGSEIIADIESRISELFAIRLQSGAPTIQRADVLKVTDTLGAADELANPSPGAEPTAPVLLASGPQGSDAHPRQKHRRPMRRIYRSRTDRMLGGVCGGLGHYFGMDPVFIRIIWVALAFAGIGILAYLIAWAVIPLVPKGYTETGEPITVQSLKENMTEELQALRMRGEEMSRELRDFFRGRKPQP